MRGNRRGATRPPRDRGAAGRAQELSSGLRSLNQEGLGPFGQALGTSKDKGPARNTEVKIEAFSKPGSQNVGCSAATGLKDNSMQRRGGHETRLLTGGSEKQVERGHCGVSCSFL